MEQDESAGPCDALIATGLRCHHSIEEQHLHGSQLLELRRHEDWDTFVRPSAEWREPRPA